MRPMYFYKNVNGYVPCCKGVEEGFKFLLKEGKKEYRLMWVMNGKVISGEDLTSIHFNTKEECDECYDFANKYLGFHCLVKTEKAIDFSQTSTASIEALPVYVDNGVGLYIYTTNYDNIAVPHIKDIFEKKKVLSTTFKLTKMINKVNDEVEKDGYCILDKSNDINVIDKSHFAILELCFGTRYFYGIFDLSKVKEDKKKNIPFVINPKSEEDRKSLLASIESIKGLLNCKVWVTEVSDKQPKA